MFHHEEKIIYLFRILQLEIYYTYTYIYVHIYGTRYT